MKARGPGTVPRSHLSMGGAWWIGALIWVVIGAAAVGVATVANKDRATRQ